MKCRFKAGDLFNVPAAAVVSRRHGVVFSANPLQAFPIVKGAQAPRLNAPPSPVHHLCLSRDEHSLAVATDDIVKIVNTTTGREVRTLVGHLSPVSSICAFNKNVYNWASGSHDGLWIVWDVRQHPPSILQARAPAPITVVTISPDDRLLLVGTKAGIQLYDWQNRLLVKQISHTSVLGASFHPTEYLLCTFGADHIVRFWDLDSFEPVCWSESTDSPIRSASFVPNGDLLLTCTDDCVRLVSWEPWHVLASEELPLQSQVIDVFPSNDSFDVLCSFSDRSLSLYTSTYLEVLSTGSDAEHESDSPSTSTPSEASDGGVEDAITPDSEHSLERDVEVVMRELIVEVPRNDPLSPANAKDGSRSDLNATVPTLKTAKRTPPTAPPGSQRQSTGRLATTPSPSTSSLASLATAPRTRNVTPTGRPPMGTRASTTIKKPSSSKSNMQDSRARSASFTKLNASAQKPPVARFTCRTSSVKKVAKSREISPERANESENFDPETTDSALEYVITQRAAFSRAIAEKERNLNNVTTAWRRRGVEVAVESAANDSLSFAALCSHATQLNKWRLALAAQLLPKIRILLHDDSVEMRRCALDALSKIITQLGDAIRLNVRPVGSIGVDVAAEERGQNASKCAKELLELRINSSFSKDYMQPTEVAEFDALIELIDKICAH